MIQGHGLFASRDIQAGEEVVRFGAGMEMAAARWPAHCQGKGLPLWGAFHSGRPGVGVAYDPTWQSMSQRPKWSYLNAASDPNAEMDPTSWPLLVCRAKRRICVGEEICISLSCLLICAKCGAPVKCVIHMKSAPFGKRLGVRCPGDN